MMNKRLISLALIAVMLVSLPFSAFAGSHSSTISSIHSSFVTGNIRTNSAEQQKANGTYRMVELLEAIAYALD